MFLSMTTSVSPSRFNVPRHCQISARTSGASPSVASSRINRRGLVISARPIASICCSPPESWLPRCADRSFEARKQRMDAIERPRWAGPVARQPRGRHEILAHGERRKNLPHLRHEADARLRDPIRRPGADRTPVEPNLAAMRREHADDAFHRRGLAHAVAPEQRDALARLRRRTTRRTAPGWCRRTPSGSRPRAAP